MLRWKLDSLGGRAWLVFWIGMFLFYFLQVLFFRTPSELPHAVDFRMRYNEAECVRHGKDPYLVWNGTLKSGKYTPWSFERLYSADELSFVHAYPPWSYAWMLPLTCVSRDSAEAVFRGITWCGFLFIVGCAFSLGYKAKSEAWAGFAAAAAALLAWRSVLDCLVCLNYGVLITAAAMMALLCHRKRQDWIAGLFWAFTLVKPQIGGLFMVALLVRRKWRTLLVAGLITLFGTLLSAYLCHRSPMEMILSIVQYSQGQFHSTGFVPRGLFALLEPRLGESALMAGSAAVGALLCVFLSWRLRTCDDVFEWAMPAVFLSTLWVAARLHDQAIDAIMFLGLALSAVRETKICRLVCDTTLMLLLLSRGLDDTFLFPVNLTQLLALILLFVRAKRYYCSAQKGSKDEDIRCNPSL